MVEDALRHEGVTREDAHSQAARVLGNVMLARESARAVWIGVPLESIYQDLRYGVRSLIRSPAFTLAALAALVLGLGLNLTFLNIANAFLLRPWPVPNPGRVVIIWDRMRPSTSNQVTMAPSTRGEYFFFREHAHTIDVATANLFTNVHIGADRRHLPRPTAAVSDNYFDVVKIPIALGRGFQAGDDDTRHAATVAVISDRLWRAEFGASTAIISRTMWIEDVPFTIVGVAAPEAFFGESTQQPDLWLPFSSTVSLFQPHGTPEQRAADIAEQLKHEDQTGVQLVGRLKDPFTRADAGAELSTLASQFHRARGEPLEGVVLTGTAPIERPDPGGGLRIVSLVFAGSMLVLLVACANVGNLNLARTLARRHEMSVRLSLGADRQRIVRQLLTEGVLLAAIATGASLCVAALLPPILFRRLLSSEDMFAWHVTPDIRVVAGAGVLAIVVCLVSALLPAMRSTRTISSSRCATEGPAPHLRSGLLGMQVALSTVLLLAAALLASGIVHAASATHMGFDPRAVAVVSADLPRESMDPGHHRVFAQTVMAALSGAAMPDIGAIQIPPFAGISQESVRRPDQDEHAEMFPPVNVVTSGYFSVLHIRVASGRVFRDGETVTNVVVNQQLAAALWPGETAVGRPLIVNKEERRVVGVVQDTYVNSLDHLEPTLFENGSDGSAFGNLLVPNDTAALEEVRAAITATEPRAVVRITPLMNTLRDELEGSVVAGLIAAAMGLLALALAAVGTFGVFSFVVIERTREIGIRMAIGATGRGVLTLLLRRAATSLAYGFAAGVAITLVAGPLLADYLYGLSPRDPAAFAAAAGLLALTSTLATWLPAWRATRIDPAITLRHD
jgi:predicted permease